MELKSLMLYTKRSPVLSLLRELRNLKQGGDVEVVEVGVRPVYWGCIEGEWG